MLIVKCKNWKTEEKKKKKKNQEEQKGQIEIKALRYLKRNWNRYLLNNIVLILNILTYDKSFIWTNIKINEVIKKIIEIGKDKRIK